MSALFFHIDDLSLMVIPDTQAHLNGHTIITYTYSIFRDSESTSDSLEKSKSNQLHLTKHNDPNYLGFITFEDPGKLFTYTADGKEDLTADQVEQVIEQISHYRDNPDLWRHLHQ